MRGGKFFDQVFGFGHTVEGRQFEQGITFVRQGQIAAADHDAAGRRPHLTGGPCQHRFDPPGALGPGQHTNEMHDVKSAAQTGANADFIETQGFACLVY